jgi:hypothetical protein
LAGSIFRLQHLTGIVAFLLLPICSPAFAHWKPQYADSDAAMQKWGAVRDLVGIRRGAISGISRVAS